MNRRHEFFKALGIVALSLLAIEGFLRLVDPWGMIYFENVMRNSGRVFVADPVRGYIMRDGHKALGGSQQTIRQGRRVIPDTQPSDCQLAFLGDSVTYGAVPDEQTFVNLIAAQLPGVEVLNYAVPRYNSDNVARTRLAVSGHDAYLYVIFNNDGEPNFDPDTQSLVGGYRQPWIVLYMKYALGRTAPPAPVDHDRVFRDLDKMLAAGRTWLVAFADDVLTDAIVEAGYPVEVIPYPADRVSVVDFHPNARGNIEIARDLLPYVREIVAQTC